jgi:hypothetical protein
LLVAIAAVKVVRSSMMLECSCGNNKAERTWYHKVYHKNVEGWVYRDEHLCDVSAFFEIIACAELLEHKSLLELQGLEFLCAKELVGSL